MGRRELAAHLPRKAAIRPIVDANAAGQSYENDKRPPSQRRMVAINAVAIPATINLRLAAVRRVAYEAADAGLLSPELAAGIRRVKGVRRLGVRLGNWLTPDQGRRLLNHAQHTPRGA